MLIPVTVIILSLKGRIRSGGGEALAEGEHVGRGAEEGAGAVVRVGEGDEVARVGGVGRGEVLGVGGEG